MVVQKEHSSRTFNLISWVVTALIVISLLGFTLWRIFPASASPGMITTQTSKSSEPVEMPGMGDKQEDTEAIVRVVALDTSAGSEIRYEVIKYTVKRGDTVSSIAEEYGIDSSSLMWANEALMQNGPNSLSLGQVLLIPPVDGVLYKWEDGDTMEDVAERFDVTSDDILLWPGNNIDLSDPTIETGSYMMIPGGKSDAILWISPVFASGSSGTSFGRVASCGDAGPVGGGGTLLYPSPYHYILGGNPYTPSHLAIDLYAPEGTAITAADSGVVVWASVGEWNGGYGNVVMIDHRNGFMTLYGHLSQVNVLLCQPIYAGEIVGLSGNTGNSFGAHLHFEVRLGGGFVNPWDYLPPP